MKKSLVLTGVLLALTASLASAAPSGGNLLLGWSFGSGNACPTNAANPIDMVDPCDGTGFEQLVGGVQAPSGLTQVTGEEAIVDLQTEGSALPPFWHLETGGCGDGAILMEAAFTGYTTGTTATTCSNYWGSAASGGFHWYVGPSTIPQLAANRARLDGVFARGTGATSMVAGRNYYVFRASLTTSQAPNCPGCNLGACWVFNYLLLTQPAGVGDATIDPGNTSPTRNWVTWNGAVNVQPSGCPTATPAARTTWGQVKSLYR